MSKSCLSCAVSFLKASHFSRPWSPWPGNTWGSCLRSRLLASDFVTTSLSSSLSSSSAKYAHARRVSQFLGSSLLYCPFFSFFRTHHLWSDYGIYYKVCTVCAEHRGRRRLALPLGQEESRRQEVALRRRQGSSSRMHQLWCVIRKLSLLTQTWKHWRKTTKY